MGDHTAAMTAAAMVSAALYERSNGERGQLVSTSLLRQGAYTIGFDVNVTLMWGRPGVRGPGDDGQPDHQQLHHERRAALLARRPRRRTALARARARRRAALLARRRTVPDAAGAIHERPRADRRPRCHLPSRPRREWATIFDPEPDLFWAPVNTVDDLLADEQFHASGAVVRVPDEQGTVPMLASPADFGGLPVVPRWHAPRLGEHTEEILRELGRDDIEGRP